MKPRILLINPPIYDFSAYDFWLKPYGMLRVAGFLHGQADLSLFDFLDRFDPRVPPGNYRADRWGRGEFHSAIAAKPAVFENIPRHFRRFGLLRAEFQNFLDNQSCFDYALIQTGMTYWYLGLKEVIADLDNSMRFVHALGIRLMLSEFSPIPGTPDGERCRRWIDLDEPLWHNKTAFTTQSLGAPEVNRLKRLARDLNYRLQMTDAGAGTGLASGRRASKIEKLPAASPVSVS